MNFNGFGLEKRFGELSQSVGIIRLAAEEVYISGIRQIGKMTRNQGCFDELDHGMPFHPFIISKVDNLTGAKPFHVDQFTEFHNILLYLIGITNRGGVTVIKVKPCHKAPRGGSFSMGGPNSLLRKGGFYSPMILTRTLFFLRPSNSP